MKRSLLSLFVACLAVAVAFGYLHHRRIEKQRAAFDAALLSSPAPTTASKNTPTADSDSSPNLVDRLPPGASAVIFANVAALRVSSFANELSSLAPASTQDPAYTQFVHATGFDYSRDLDRVAVALWPQTSATSVLALAEGRFNEPKIENYALRNGGRRVRIRGADVYEVREENSARLVRFTFLGSDEIALADGPAISQVLGPPAARLDSQMSASIAAVSRAPICAVARSTDFAKDLNIDATKNSQLAALLRSIHTITVAGRPAGENLNVSTSAYCDSTIHAVELSTALQGLLWMGRAALADSRTQQQIGPEWPVFDALLKAADISHEGHSVRLRLQVTPQMLRAATASANGTASK